MIIHSNYKLFLAEAEEAIKKEGALKVARLDYDNKTQQGISIATIESSFVSQGSDIKYTETVGYCTDPSFCIEEDLQKAAGLHLQSLADQTKERFKEISSELKKMGYEVRRGVAQ